MSLLTASLREAESGVTFQEENISTAGHNKMSSTPGLMATRGATAGRGETMIVTPPSKSWKETEQSAIIVAPVGTMEASGLPESIRRMAKVDLLDPKEIFSNPDFVPLQLVKKRSPEFFLIELKGGIELIYCDIGPAEAFLKPLTDLLFHNKVVGREQQAKMAMLKRGKFIAHVFRRESKNSNTAMLKGDGSNYKRTCLVRYVGPKGSSKAEQKEVLLMLQEVSTKGRH